MRIYGTIVGGEFRCSPDQERIEKHYLSALKDNTLAYRETKKFIQGKTHQQVKTIFGLMINSTIAQANDLGIDISYLLKYLIDDKIPKGQGLTKDFLHELMYIICPTTDEDGKRITLSKMNIEQAGKLFESFRNTISTIGIVIDDPNPELAKIKDKK